MGFAVIVVLLAYVLTLKKNVINGKSRPHKARRRVWSGWIALRSLCIALLTAFAIAGWWFLMMWSRDGMDFFSDWFTRTSYNNISATVHENSGIPSTFAGFAVHQIISMLGLLVGLSLFGFWRACREVFLGRDEQKRHGCLFLIAWTGTAAFVLLGLLWESNATADHLALYKGFLLVPSVALAAFAIDEIAERRVDVRVVASILFFTIAALAGKHRIVDIENGNFQSVAWPLMILFALATLFVWQVGLICTENDSRHRLVIGSVIVVLIAFNSVSGLSSFRKEGPVNRELTALRNELTQNDDENFKSTTLIIQSETPFRLHFLLRSLYPNADFQIVKNWDAVLSQATADRSEPAVKRLIVNWNPQERTTGTISIPGSETTEIILPQETRPRRYWLSLKKSTPAVANSRGAESETDPLPPRRLRAYVVTPSTEYQQD
ncbi:MAG: hypothetical protein IH899_10585 [Planctomycetes bacterium]|nr:hypothetical protein [Planctomycetota bacterium]